MRVDTLTLSSPQIAASVAAIVARFNSISFLLGIDNQRGHVVMVNVVVLAMLVGCT